jgi:hypothetical protein
MKNVGSKNTKQRGILRFFIYFDKTDREFVGVCVDLGIVKTSNDPNRLKQDLESAAIGYLEVINKNNLPDYLLNQKPPKIYIDIFNEIQSAIEASGPDKYKVDLNETQTFFKRVADLCPAC